MATEILAYYSRGRKNTVSALIFNGEICHVAEITMSVDIQELVLDNVEKVKNRHELFRLAADRDEQVLRDRLWSKCREYLMDAVQADRRDQSSIEFSPAQQPRLWFDLGDGRRAARIEGFSWNWVVGPDTPSLDLGYYDGMVWLRRSVSLYEIKDIEALKALKHTLINHI